MTRRSFKERTIRLTRVTIRTLDTADDFTMVLHGHREGGRGGKRQRPSGAQRTKKGAQ